MSTQVQAKMHDDLRRAYLLRRYNWMLDIVPRMPQHEWRQLEEWWSGFLFDGSTGRNAATVIGAHEDPVFRCLLKEAFPLETLLRQQREDRQ